MKRFKYIIMAMVGTLFASCMGSDYAAAELDADNAPYGNNDITETNVITIAELKEKYASVISNSGYEQITEDLQIKGIVTGNDYAGNIYQQVSLQDETGALIVGISASALYSYLPVGQQILVDLKDLYVGGYGRQCQVGGLYTSTSTGNTSIGRMDRYTWQDHFRIIGTADEAKADALCEDFDVSSISNDTYRTANCGKLMTIHGVSFKDANGTAVFAPDDGSVTLTSNCANRALSEYSSSYIVVRTSTYADFANEALPEGSKDIKGIFTRYNNVWQILLRSTDDITEATSSGGSTAALDEPFDDDQGDFTIVDEYLADGLSYVWSWASASYGMKASAYANSTNYEAASMLISPAIDLSEYTSATLSFEQAGNYFANNVSDECSVLVSTDKENWSELEVTGWPTENSWTFVTSTADLSAYAGQSEVYIAFRYSSTASKAGTWEVKSVVVE